MEGVVDSAYQATSEAKVVQQTPATDKYLGPG